MIHFSLILTASWILATADSSIAPCITTTESSGERSVSCEGPLGLPFLTNLLKKELCGNKIQKFELRDSDVGYLPSDLFSKVVVEDIQISFTPIGNFSLSESSTFSGLEPHLKSLSIRHCNLQDSSTHWIKLGELYKLSYLDLSFNGLSTVGSGWFRVPPPALRSLILKGNRISSLDTGCFKHMYSLVELDLSGNKIGEISRTIFPKFSNQLIFLRLSDNMLTALPDNFFDDMLGIRRLYLDGNEMQSLPKQAWSLIWGDLNLLDLSGNPLKCDCELEWVSTLSPPRLLYGACDGKELKNLKQSDFKNCTE